jgi:hypothetical protein
MAPTLSALQFLQLPLNLLSRLGVEDSLMLLEQVHCSVHLAGRRVCRQQSLYC